MKKRYLFAALFFETAACLGAYFLQFFTARKLGMRRWVNHLCNNWSKAVDLDRVNLILMLLIAAFALVLLVWTIRRVKPGNFALMALAATAAAAVGIYLVCTLRYTRRLMAAYYLVCPVLLLGAVTVLVCWALAVWKSK